MLVMGDVFWGRYINDWSKASGVGYAYPFSRLGEFDRSSYDAWIANLECPVTNNPKVSSAQEDATLKFDCSPDYLPEATKWFTAFSLGNNHTDNQGGQVGQTETRQHLGENGIQNFGSYEPLDYDNLCDVVSIPVHIRLSDNTEKTGKLPMVWYGYNGVFKTPSTESIAVISRYAEHFNVVAMPHSGAEYMPAPDQIKMNFYHALIDNGADVVLGDHPHWVQSSEAYNGHLIVYSMGNFIFDQQAGKEMTRSAVIDMTVSVTAEQAANLDEWLALGETCGAYADDCLARATEKNLTKLPLEYHFAVRGGDSSGKITKPASTAQIDSIKQRMNWPATVQGLSGVYSGEL
jgi:poly-gamma-glutamate synthesis protein (capsule biosynthesis protein)